MVSFTTFATSALAVLPLASAYVTGFTAPATAEAGSTITATLQTAIYIENWEDYSIVWGLTPSAWDCSICIGTQIGYVALTGTEGAAYPYTFTESVTIPSGTSAGDYYLKAAIPHLVGASGEMGFNIYGVNVTVS
ncbi:hypothetical protein M406DRAFT_69377 [Cryphonectria parasitica EP155]|uniref:Uncharacterized protein n=1 Tax=Cryphonectria parasitica (strain ATCC 38755 / EP155) TaxID=660469 RepID=A0A9P4Y665_CRYP1|nr:uncharacterized protein M406DRAFT_69377 [Cryphonectria parasitica EP155]KAF3767215.1 hypothetical protein M406DRAFT_69377 [Cryphonectria parasitica EP155]